LCEDAYGEGFGHPATAPLKQLGPDDWLLELFHGPTLAFKDFAMRLLARMFDRVLSRRGRQVTIVGATSGDTGAAAVRAFAGMANLRVAMLHPHGRVSAVQRRQMTTETAPNILNIAVNGTFDDCQDLVKAMFADARFRDEMALSAVNSINWARVAAQAAYYVHAALRLGAPDRAVAFCVPTGNFGNVYAAGPRADSGCRSPSSSWPPTATTSWPASSPTAPTPAAPSCPRSARRWTSRWPATSSASCSRWRAGTATASVN
jgi:threonine synthase